MRVMSKMPGKTIRTSSGIPVEVVYDAEDLDGFDAAASAARTALANDPAPLVQSLLYMTGGDGGAAIDASALLAKSSADYPTLDRALTLLWVRKALGGDTAPALMSESDAALIALAVRRLSFAVYHSGASAATALRKKISTEGTEGSKGLLDIALAAGSAS